MASNHRACPWRCPVNLAPLPQTQPYTVGLPGAIRRLFIGVRRMMLLEVLPGLQMCSKGVAAHAASAVQSGEQHGGSAFECVASEAQELALCTLRRLPSTYDSCAVKQQAPGDAVHGPLRVGSAS
jgi:hypothetical protein